jgi:hypothetical protein
MEGEIYNYGDERLARLHLWGWTSGVPFFHNGEEFALSKGDYRFTGQGVTFEEARDRAIKAAYEIENLIFHNAEAIL